MFLAPVRAKATCVPTVTRDGQPGKTVRVPCVGVPDEAQRVLPKRLGPRPPQHYLEEVAKI